MPRGVVKARAKRSERRFADFVLRGGSVVTMPGRPTAADAVAIRDGVVRAVGDERAVIRAAGPSTQVLDLRGSVVVPGLTDCHVHPGWAAEFAQGADCSTCCTPAELAAALRTQRSAVEADTVVRAFGVDQRLFQASGARGDVLERLAGGPALVTFADCHSYLATPGLLSKAGIVGELRWPDGGRIMVDDDGLPTGEAHEFSAYERLTAGLPALTFAQRAAAARGARPHGVARTDRRARDERLSGGLRLVRGAGGQHELPLRLVVPLWLKPDDGEDRVQQFLALRDAHGALWRGAR